MINFIALDNTAYTDMVADSDGGVIRRYGTTFSFGSKKDANTWKTADGKITYKRGNGGNDLLIKFADGADSITIKDFRFDLALLKIEDTQRPYTAGARSNQAAFNIQLDNAEIKLVAGTGKANSAAPELREGGESTFTAFVSAATDYVRTLRLEIGNCDGTKFGLCSGADTLDFSANGEVELTLAAGETAVTFALVTTGDIDESVLLDLSATLIDPQASDYTPPSADISVAFTSVEEADPAGRPIITSMPGHGDLLTNHGPAPEIFGDTNPAGGAVTFQGNDFGEIIGVTNSSDKVDAESKFSVPFFLFSSYRVSWRKHGIRSLLRRLGSLMQDHTPNTRRHWIARVLAVYWIGMSAAVGSESREIVPNKYDIDALQSALFLVMSIAFAKETGAGKARIGTSVSWGKDGQMDVEGTIRVLAGEPGSFLDRGIDLVRQPCEYLDLPDANNRLVASRNYPGISSLPHPSMRGEITTAKVLLDCREALSPVHIERIEKMRPRWDYFRGRLYIKFRVVRGSAGPEEKLIATRIVKFKGKENE